MFDEAIAVLTTQPLGRERVDWKTVAAALRSTIPATGEPRLAHAAIEAAVRRLNDPHARFVPPPAESPAAAVSTSAATARSAASLTTSASETAALGSAAPSTAPGEPSGSLSARAVPVEPAGRLLDDGVAYVVLPMCSAPDVDGLRQYAAQLRAVLLALEDRHPRAWLVDLRFNGGGNVWPMFVGLRPLLGDGVAATSVVAGRVVARSGCTGTVAWMERGAGPAEQLRIEPVFGDRLARPAPLAVLIGPWTMSSGEMIALAFAERERTRLFGEPTAGLTTVTNFFPLSDGSILNLPVEQMATRGGAAAAGPVRPDEVVRDVAWPGPDDAAARAARAWLLRSSNRSHRS